MGKKLGGKDDPSLHQAGSLSHPLPRAGVITAPQVLALVMLQGRRLLLPWPRADMLQVACPQAPGRGLPHSGHPNELMQQGRDAHPIPGATLNPAWVQEGDGAERRRGAEPEKHHCGLHFITMATSWKPYRI